METEATGSLTQPALDALFAEARRIEVRAFQLMDDGTGKRELLLNIERDDVPAVHELLRIQESDTSFHCDCDGDFDVELHGEAGRVATISFHHGRSIRLAKPGHDWDSGAALLDGPALLRWLADRGVTGPLDRFEQDKRSLEASEDAHRAWAEAAPPGLDLDLLGDDKLPPFNDGSIYDPALEAFAVACPSAEERALGLLGWFSVSSMTWFVSPMYEEIPGLLLARIDMPAVLRALERGPVTEAALVGAARFMVRALQVGRESEVASVPDGLWIQLIDATARRGVKENTEGIERAAAVARAQQHFMKDP
jgi:hypothetical protein